MCKQNHMCAKVIQVRLFGTHPNGIAVFTPAQKICTKGENKLVFDSIKPNKTGFNSRLDTKIMLGSALIDLRVTPPAGKQYEHCLLCEDTL